MDVLRVVAALMVVFYHFFFYSWHETGNGGLREVIGHPIAFPEAVSATWWGWIGVYIFFVISGFVITMSAEGKTARVFAIGRVGRLYPALLVFASLALMVAVVSTTLAPADAAMRWLRGVALFPKGPWIDGAIWTLTVEVMFYAMILACLMLGRFDRIGVFVRVALVAICVFWALVGLHAVIGLGGLGALVSKLASAYASKFFLLTTGSFFILGMLLYEVHSRGISAERLGYLLAATVTSMAALHVFAANTPGVVVHGQSTWIPVLIWLGFTVLCAAAVLVEGRWQAPQVYRRIGRALGLMTYPLYLINQITGAFVIRLLLDAGLSPLAACLWAIAVIVVLSHLFAARMEPPMRRSIERALSGVLGTRQPERRKGQPAG